MQTFLPYKDFVASARCLDRARLGKQRVEVLQLLNALLLPKPSGWRNHPAARMWRGHEGSLAVYGNEVCHEWIRRGYKDSVREKILKHMLPFLFKPTLLPSWLGDEAFHASHRSNLLRKDPAWYGQFGWTEPSNLPYVWPVA